MVVGFSTSFAQTSASLFMAKKIKEMYPHISIVFGGANTDSEMGFEILKGFDWIDYVVHGEGEVSFPRLLNAIFEGDTSFPLPGVSHAVEPLWCRADFNAEPFRNLNESPVPDYSDYFQAVEQAGLHKKVRISLSFESSRGCWWGAKHHCTFCGLNATTMAFRKEDAGKSLPGHYGNFAEVPLVSTWMPSITFWRWIILRISSPGWPRQVSIWRFSMKSKQI